MSEDVQDEHAFGPVVDSGDQSVVVTMNIEYGSPPYYLRMSEIMLRVYQRIPVCSLGDSVPVHKRDQCIWMPLGERKNRRLAEHPHMISLQNVNTNIHLYFSLRFAIRIAGAPLNRCPLAAGSITIGAGYIRMSSELAGSGDASFHTVRWAFPQERNSDCVLNL